MGRVAISRVGEPDFIWTPYQGFNSTLSENTLGLAFSYVRALRPGLLNEAKLGRTSDNLGWNRPHPEIPTLALPDIPNGATQQYQLYLPGSPAFYAYSNNNTTWEMLDNLTWVRGRHLFTAGGGALPRSSQGFLTAGRDGEYIFNGVFNFILDSPSQFSTSVSRKALPDLQQPDFNRQYRYNQYFLFAQDTFKVTSRLTLNYGIRYENFGAPSNTGPVKGRFGGAAGARPEFPAASGKASRADLYQSTGPGVRERADLQIRWHRVSRHGSASQAICSENPARWCAALTASSSTGHSTTPSAECPHQ